MTSISQMKAELVKNSVSASAVESMTEQQLINACKERNIKIQETLNQNANWGRGDEVEISTGKQQVDPYSQKDNRVVEKKDEALAASLKYLKEGNLGLAFATLFGAAEPKSEQKQKPVSKPETITSETVINILSRQVTKEDIQNLGRKIL